MRKIQITYYTKDINGGYHLADPQPILHDPLTKTVVGNYLRTHRNGDVDMYRNGFKDGVRFAESKHKIKETGQ